MTGERDSLRLRERGGYRLCGNTSADFCMFFPTSVAGEVLGGEDREALFPEYYHFQEGSKSRQIYKYIVLLREIVR